MQFNNASYSVNENAGTATITVTLNAASPKVITANYATSDGTAIAGTHYTATNNTLTFTPGMTVTNFTVPIKDNNLNEGNKTLNLALSTPSNAILNDLAKNATLTIIDDEGAPTLQFAPATYNVDENVASGLATINVILNHPSASPITVNYATSDGTATTANSDYTAVVGTLTFAPNVTSQSFEVPIINDNTFEPNETINLSLNSTSPTTVTVFPGNGLPSTPAAIVVALQVVLAFSPSDPCGLSQVPLSGVMFGNRRSFALTPAITRHPTNATGTANFVNVMTSSLVGFAKGDSDCSIYSDDARQKNGKCKKMSRDSGMRYLAFSDNAAMHGFPIERQAE